VRLIREWHEKDSKAALIIQSYYRGFFAWRVKESIQFFDDDDYNYVEVDESLDSFRDFMESLDEPVRPLTREKEDLEAELQQLMTTIPDIPPFQDSPRLSITTPRLEIPRKKSNSKCLLQRHSSSVSSVTSLETLDLETPRLPPMMPFFDSGKKLRDNFVNRQSPSPFHHPSSSSIDSVHASKAGDELRNPSIAPSRGADTSTRLVTGFSKSKILPSSSPSHQSDEQKAMEDWNFKEMSTAEAWIKRKNRLSRKKKLKKTAGQRFKKFERNFRKRKGK